MLSDDWQPSASLLTLKKRAELLKKIRWYFDSKNVMEVETPILSRGATVDLYIDSFTASFNPIGGGDSQRCYLHTSPEFPMKRLLAAGSGDIYYLGKVFRNGEAGGRHNPEFTMLEYYRVGMNQQLLMDDLSEMLESVTHFREMTRISYGELFEQYLGVNPHTVTDIQLEQLVRDKIDAQLKGLDRTDCLDLLFSKFVEPCLGEGADGELQGVYVYDYPACMSALARLHENNHGETVAARFELFVNGIELANGYHELLDGVEQKARFEAEQAKRRDTGLPVYPYDQRLVSALEYGMPDCAGVAMGLDRLMMLMLGSQTISDVIAFDFHRA